MDFYRNDWYFHKISTIFLIWEGGGDSLSQTTGILVVANYRLFWLWQITGILDKTHRSWYLIICWAANGMELKSIKRHAFYDKVILNEMKIHKQWNYLLKKKTFLQRNITEHSFYFCGLRKKSILRVLWFYGRRVVFLGCNSLFVY